MDGKLNFSDYITIAVVTVALFLAADWFLKRRGGACGCARGEVKALGNIPTAATKRACA